METIHLQTEANLGACTGIDAWEDHRILAELVSGQERAIAAVRAAAPQIAEAANAIAARIGAGGRLFYAGAGTSIRIGVQDGAELPETFGIAEDRIGFMIAGGRAAMFVTAGVEEDDRAAGTSDAAICGAGDAMIAIAASGSTPYTLAAASRATENGAFVVAIVNNPSSALGNIADVEIVLNSGPEVIAGSTRMGAGTAQKSALNLLSTLAFIKLGAVHDGMMVNVRPSNAKLTRRAVGIVMRIADVAEADALSALDASSGSIKCAVLLCAGAKNLDAAQNALNGVRGNLRLALSRLAAV